MIVGGPREIKQDEYRVAMLPVGVEELTRAGHRVLVERGAGLGSGISDEEYHANGAEIVDTAAAVWNQPEAQYQRVFEVESAIGKVGKLVYEHYHNQSA